MKLSPSNTWTASQDSDPSATFHEEQRFRQPWLWAIIIVCSALTTGVNGYGMISQLVFHHPFGNNPMSDDAMMIIGPLLILVGMALPLVFWRTRLVTEVRGDGVYLRFHPFHRRFIWFQFEKILSAEAVTYKPIRDYGGGGIRYGKKGKCYNVYGNEGVRIGFTSGASLLIGSQCSRELASAIESKLARG